MISFAWIVLTAVPDTESIAELALGEIAQGRYVEALRRLDEALKESPAATESEWRLQDLRARCLFEMGDYAACESVLRELLEGSRAVDTRRGVQLKLARVLYLAGGYDEAVVLLKAVLSAGEHLEARRLIAQLLLERRRYEHLAPHVEALLAAFPEDAFGLFARGVAAAKAGRFEAAARDLRRVASDPELGRSARFELALAYAGLGRPRAALLELVEILAADPFDADACYQTGLQLLRLGGSRRARTAGRVMQYFESLKEAIGAGSRDHHLEAAGRPAEAELERARRWERVGDLRRAVEAVRRALTLRPHDADVVLGVVDFWSRQGLRAEAAAAAESVPVNDAVREFLAAQLTLPQPDGPLAQALGRLQEARWADARDALREVLRAARRASDAPLADRAARLLLARDPGSVEALRHLAERTRSGALIVPHFHYLTRLARADGTVPRWAAGAARLRDVLAGQYVTERE